MAEDLGRDVRFMSTLPTLQAMSGVRLNTGESANEVAWRERLAVIFEGLLRTTPDYLSVTYLGKEGEQLKEIIRVERQNDESGFIRRVSASRLALLPRTPFANSMLETELGNVRLSIDHRLPNDSSGAARTLAAARPVCTDDSGEVIGLVAIVTDLNMRLVGILNRLDQRLGEIYVTDANGIVWVVSHPDYGAHIGPRNFNVVDAVPVVKKFLSGETLGNYHSDFSTFTVQRVQLDAIDPSCSLAIVQRLTAKE